MQKIYFSNYNDLSNFPSVGKVAGVQNETNYYNLNKVSSVKNNSLELRLESMAVITSDWTYYRILLDVHKDKLEAQAAHKEILTKYPYDGKSSFAELLAAEVSKLNQ